MHNKQSILFTLAAAVCISCTFIACQKEEALTPTPVFVEAYDLSKQAWSTKSDTTILNFFNSTGCYILYKFDNENISFGKNAKQYVIPPTAADKDTLDMAVDFVVNKQLRIYPNDLLRLLLPYKIILCKGFRNYNADGSVKTSDDPTFSTGYNPFQPNYSYPLADGTTAADVPNAIHLGIIFGSYMPYWGTEPGDMEDGFFPKYSTESSASTFKVNFHANLWTRAFIKGQIKVPPFFAAMTDYTGLNAASPAAAAIATARPSPDMDADRKVHRAYGSVSSGGVALTPEADFILFIQYILKNTKSNFERSYITNAMAPDVNGKVRAKRDAIIQYYKDTYKFDLQSISGL